MQPPYTLTPQIFHLVTAISEKLGEAKALYLDVPTPQLRKRNKIQTIHASLKIEGNTLSEAQITAILDNKRVVGPQADIREVQNAIAVYEDIRTYTPTSVKSFLAAHKTLMTGLIDKPGAYRRGGVGILHGSQVAHVAPPAGNVPFLMNDLFDYLNTSEDHPLIKSCVFHYEVEFIHPFQDGNGRMGRLWQSVILAQAYPVFTHLPFETLISAEQEAYYQALAQSDKAGNSTAFITYMLEIIDSALASLLSFHNRALTAQDRLTYFCSLGTDSFSRKDYMEVFKDISSATASRDLKLGVAQGLLTKEGEKRNTRYRCMEKSADNI